MEPTSRPPVPPPREKPQFLGPKPKVGVEGGSTPVPPAVTQRLPAKTPAAEPTDIPKEGERGLGEHKVVARPLPKLPAGPPPAKLPRREDAAIIPAAVPKASKPPQLAAEPVAEKVSEEPAASTAEASASLRRGGQSKKPVEPMDRPLSEVEEEAAEEEEEAAQLPPERRIDDKAGQTLPSTRRGSMEEPRETVAAKSGGIMGGLRSFVKGPTPEEVTAKVVKDIEKEANEFNKLTDEVARKNTSIKNLDTGRTVIPVRDQKVGSKVLQEIPKLREALQEEIREAKSKLEKMSKSTDFKDQAESIAAAVVKHNPKPEDQIKAFQIIIDNLNAKRHEIVTAMTKDLSEGKVHQRDTLVKLIGVLQDSSRELTEKLSMGKAQIEKQLGKAEEKLAEKERKIGEKLEKEQAKLKAEKDAKTAAFEAQKRALEEKRRRKLGSE